jgi:hypothetical protein
MSVTVDSLQLEIQSSSNSAISGLEELERTLRKVRGAVGKGLGLTRFSNDLGRLSTALDGVTSAKVANLGQLGASLKTFETLGKVTISSTIANSITNISNATNSLTSESIGRLNALSPALLSLQALGNVKISSTIAKGLTEISTAANEMQGVDFAPVANLASTLTPLNNLRGLSLGSIVNRLREFPKVAREIETIDFNRFASSVRTLASALQPLGDVMNRVSAGFANFPRRAQQLAAATQTIPSATRAATASFANFSVSIGATYLAVKRVMQVIAGFINKSNEYVENLNLFNVAMGEFASKAKNYAENVGEVMGIDPSDWMRNQGIFMNLASGFGVASDRAYIMSQNLTQLGYDISSFFNIPIAESMQKLESGISGEIEPLNLAA